MDDFGRESNNKTIKIIIAVAVIISIVVGVYFLTKEETVEEKIDREEREEKAKDDAEEKAEEKKIERKAKAAERNAIREAEAAEAKVIADAAIAATNKAVAETKRKKRKADEAVAAEIAETERLAQIVRDENASKQQIEAAKRNIKKLCYEAKAAEAAATASVAKTIAAEAKSNAAIAEQKVADENVILEEKKEKEEKVKREREAADTKRDDEKKEADETKEKIKKATAKTAAETALIARGGCPKHPYGIGEYWMRMLEHKRVPGIPQLSMCKGQWFYKQKPTCVGVGAANMGCRTGLYCTKGGTATRLPAKHGGSDIQMRALMHAIKYGKGVHPYCPIYKTCPQSHRTIQKGKYASSGQIGGRFIKSSSYIKKRSGLINKVSACRGQWYIDGNPTCIPFGDPGGECDPALFYCDKNKKIWSRQNQALKLSCATRYAKNKTPIYMLSRIKGSGIRYKCPQTWHLRGRMDNKLLLK